MIRTFFSIKKWNIQAALNVHSGACEGLRLICQGAEKLMEQAVMLARRSRRTVCNVSR